MQSKWVLGSETRNISILRKPPLIFLFSNILISFWLCLSVIKLYFRNDIILKYFFQYVLHSFIINLIYFSLDLNNMLVHEGKLYPLFF